MEAPHLMLMILTFMMIIVTMIMCFVSFKCGLPSLEECKALAEAAMCEGDLFSAVKFHLLSSEPENALQIGIDHIKGIVCCYLAYICQMTSTMKQLAIFLYHNLYIYCI